MLYSLVHERSTGLSLYFYFQLFPLLPIIVATAGNVRRAGQLELCGNGAAHSCTAARDAASGISLHVVHVGYSLT